MACPRPHPTGSRRRWRVAPRLLAVLFAGVLAACAPQVQWAGPPVSQPRLNDDTITTADGLPLPLRRWLPEDQPTGQPKAVILALHGFNDYSNAFDGAGHYWAKRGIATYAYDQRGFGGAPHRGLWAGTATYADDLRMAAALLRARHPGVPFYILGESMGGAIVMVAMTSADAPAADGVILVAPAVWGRGFMPFYQTVPLWFASRMIPWWEVTGEGLDIRPSDNIEMLRKFARDPMVIKSTRIDTIHGLVDLMDQAQDAAATFTPRSLILYGAKDEVVPDNPTFAMIRRLPEHNPPLHKVAIYAKGYHMLLRDLQAETVMADVVAWLSAPDRPLPSGADYKPADAEKNDPRPAADAMSSQP